MIDASISLVTAHRRPELRGSDCWKTLIPGAHIWGSRLQGSREIQQPVKKMVIKTWRVHYSTVSLHSRLDYLTSEQFKQQHRVSST